MQYLVAAFRRMSAPIRAAEPDSAAPGIPWMRGKDVIMALVAGDHLHYNEIAHMRREFLTWVHSLGFESGSPRFFAG